MDLGLCAYAIYCSCSVFVDSAPPISFFYRPASSKTAAQPKSVAIAGDSTVFISEIDTVEAFRFNQKVFEQKPKYQPGAIAAHGSVVAIGEVCDRLFALCAFKFNCQHDLFFVFCLSGAKSSSP